MPPVTACPGEDTLLGLARGTLAEDARARVVAHLEGCAICQGVVGGLARADEAGGPAAAAAPATIGRYRLERPVGAGAMGVVWAAHDPELDRAVAVKLLREGHDGDDARRLEERLVAEARALAKLAHPNVIAAFEVGRQDGEVFIAMELVDGQTLAAWLAAAPRAPREIVGAFLQAGEGLCAAHDAGIVHRDFKPDNVLVGRDGRVRVTDFGLASGALAGGPAVRLPLGDGEAALTRTGALAGTPAFMAPEQLEGRAASPKSDQFAFGVALWTALFGRRPFAGDSVPALLAAMRAGPPRAAGRAVPARLRAAVGRALAPEPSARWPDLRTLLAALAPFARPPVSRRALAAAGALAAAALAVGVAAGAARGSSSSAVATPRCDQGAAAFAATWSPARGERVRAAFAAAAPAQASAAFTSFSAAMDAYAAAWAAASDEACAATRVRHVRPEADLVARTACLELARHGAETLVGLAERATAGDPALVERALPALQALPPPDRCLREADRAGLPADPADTLAALAFERRLAAAAVIGDTGRHDEAAKLTAAVVSEAEAAGLPRVLLHARLAHAAYIVLRDPPAALALLEAAIADAQRLGDEPALATGLAQLTLALNQAGRYGEARLAAQFGAGVAARLGDPRRAAAVAQASCVAAVYLDPRTAEAGCRAARAAMLAAEGPDSVRVAQLDTQLGIVAFNHGRYADALAAFVANERLYRRLYGEHRAIDTMLDNQGWCLVELGRADEAVVILEGVVARRPDWGDPANALAMAHRALGRLDDAAAAHRHCVEHARGLGVRIEGWIGLGEVHLLAGRPAEAMAAFDAAAALITGELPTLERARLAFGRAQVFAGRGERARAQLEARAALAALDSAGKDAPTVGPAARLRERIVASKLP